MCSELQKQMDRIDTEHLYFKSALMWGKKSKKKCCNYNYDECKNERKQVRVRTKCQGTIPVIIKKQLTTSKLRAPVLKRHRKSKSFAWKSL